MPEYPNDFAPMIDQDTITLSQVIQLLKMQVVQFNDLPLDVRKVVEDHFAPKDETAVSVAELRKEKLNLVKQLVKNLASKTK